MQKIERSSSPWLVMLLVPALAVGVFKVVSDYSQAAARSEITGPITGDEIAAFLEQNTKLGGVMNNYGHVLELAHQVGPREFVNTIADDFKQPIAKPRSTAATTQLDAPSQTSNSESTASAQP